MLLHELPFQVGLDILNWVPYPVLTSFGVLAVHM